MPLFFCACSGDGSVVRIWAMGAGARPCGGPLRPFRKRAGAGGAGQKQAAWWCRRGEVGRGMERGVVEGSRTMRGGGGVAAERGRKLAEGVAGEHAARGHCLTGIEPLRGSTTSFSVTSGARSPAAFRPRWPVSAPVPAPALFLWHVPVPAPGTFPFPLPARPCPRSRHDPFPLPAPVPAAFRPAPAAVSAQKKLRAPKRGVRS